MGRIVDAAPLSANIRASAMPNGLPSKAASHYLDAIGAGAIYIALPRVGAASVHGLRRLPRGAGDIQWIAWVRDLASAKAVAATDLALQQHDDGVRRCRPLPEIIGAIEQRARDVDVVLTPHERAVERAMVLAERVDAILKNFQREGKMRAFNRCYKAHRVAMNGHAPSYAIVLSDLRAVIIRTLAQTPREQLSPNVLTRHPAEI